MTACKQNVEPEKTTPDGTTQEVTTLTGEEETPVVRTSILAEELKNYEIIHAKNSSQEVKNTEVVNLFNAIRSKYGVVLNQRSDLYYEGVASLAKGEYEIESQDEPNCPKEYTLEFPETSARYLKVVANAIPAKPQWHERPGTKGFLFIDEVIVR